MALSTITNATWPSNSAGHPGPFQDGNNAEYVVAVPSGSATDLAVYKFNGSSWSEVDSAGRPSASNNIAALSVIQDGDTLRIATHSTFPGGKTQNVDVEYHTFTMSDHASTPDEWVITNEAIVTVDVGDAGDVVEEAGIEIAVRSDGDVIVFHPGSTFSDMGTDYFQLSYSRREGGSWTTDIALNTEAINQAYPRAVMAPNDECHFTYPNNTGGIGNVAYYAATLDSANNISTRVAIATSQGGYNTARPITWDNAGTQQILVNSDGQVRRMQEDGSGDITTDLAAASYSSDLIRSINFGLAWDSVSSDAYAFFRRATDNDLGENSGSQGTSWGTDTEQEDAITLNGVWINYYNNTIGYVVLDGTTLKYGELSLGAGAQNITGSAAFAPTLSFPAGSVDLTITGGAAFAPTLSFPQGSIAALLAGGAAFTPALSFPTGSVDLTVTGGAAFAPTLSFPTGTLIQDQSVTGGSAFQPALSFPTGSVDLTVTGAAAFQPALSFPAGSVDLTVTGGAAFAPTLSFPQGSLLQEQFLTGSAAFQPGLTFGTGSVDLTVTGAAAFTPTLSFPTGEIRETQAVVGGAAFAPTLSFPSGQIDLTVTGPAAFTPALSFPAGTLIQEQFVTGAAAFQPTLSFPTGTVSQDGGAQTLVGGAAFTPGLAFPQGSVDLTVIGGAAFAPTISFPQGNVGQGQTVTGAAAFQPGLVFGAGSVNLTVTGATFAPSLSFPAGQVNVTLTGAVFAPTISFPTGTAIQEQFVTGAAVFAPSLLFPAGVLQTAESGTWQEGGLTAGIQGGGLSAGIQDSKVGVSRQS